MRYSRRSRRSRRLPFPKRRAGPVCPLGRAARRAEHHLPAPECDTKRRQVDQRAKVRARKRAVRRADREGADLRSPALAVSLGGQVDSWRIGDLIVPPDGQLGLAWLMVGQPGVGKSTAAHRLGYLCGREKRHLVVVDAKGGHDGLAQGMVAAYLAARPDAKVKSFPSERLDVWRGSPREVCNRLVETWDWTAESSYWRESAMTALRLALGQPGPPCRSGAELVRRLNPDALAGPGSTTPRSWAWSAACRPGRTTNWPASTLGSGT
jgi:hypothetical protein